MRLLWGVLLILQVARFQCKETYTEEVFFSSLPNGDLSTVFRFVVTADADVGTYDYLYLPLTIRQMLHDDIDEFRLSMSKGFWKQEAWGFQSQDESPPGILVTATFAKNVNETNAALYWTTLVKQVNGMFCSSIVEMDPGFTTSRQKGDRIFKHGHLSGEPLCTENIKPFLRLLPCKITGFSTLITPERLFSSEFYSMSVGAKRVVEDGHVTWRVELFAQLVQNRKLMRLKKIKYAFKALVDRKLTCSVADEQVFTSALKSGYGLTTFNVTESVNELLVTDIHKLDVNGKQVFSVYVNDEDEHHSPSFLFSLNTALEKFNFRSGILSSTIKSMAAMDSVATYKHVIPWQVHLGLDSLIYTCNGLPGRIFDQSYIPSLINGRPATLELKLAVPAKSTCALKVAYDNSLMTALAYPPDSNYGIFIPGPALSTIIDEEIFRTFSTVFSSFKENEIQSRAQAVPGKKRTVVLHGEPLLILLPVPDFSMPFNVICIVTVVSGFLFGSTFNMNVKVFLPILPSSSDGKSSGLWAKLSRFWRS